MHDSKFMSLKSSNDRLSIKLFHNKLSSPLIVASGTLIEKYEDIEPYLLAGAGAVVPRTTRYYMERKTHPIPHLYHYGSKKYPIMINAEWTGEDINYWRPYLNSMSLNKKTIMSISGRDLKGCVKVCKELDQYAGWPYLEIITRNEEHIRTLITELKDANLKTPIALKLGYSDHIVHLAGVAKEAGVDAIVAINTFGPVFDFSISENGQPHPVLGIRSGTGGLSGAPLFNIALTAIAAIKRQVDIPIIGSGGVITAENALKMMMAGADAVQIYSALHVRGINAPTYFTELNHELIKKMDRYGIVNITDIIGKALYILDQNTQVEVKVPTLNESQCIGCDLCIDICLPRAITTIDSTANKVGHIIQIDKKICIGCGHCVPTCPTTPRALSYS